MNNLESYNPKSSDETVYIPHGREMIPVEAALDEQKELVLRMTPEEVKRYLTNADDDPVFEALMMRYLEKYVIGEFNGFAEFCNENEGDLEFIGRAKDKTLTEEDFQKMISFIQKKSPFFSEGEVEKFLEENNLRN